MILFLTDQDAWRIFAFIDVRSMTIKLNRATQNFVLEFIKVFRNP